MKRNQMLIAEMLQFMARETAKLPLGVWHNRDNGFARGHRLCLRNSAPSRTHVVLDYIMRHSFTLHLGVLLSLYIHVHVCVCVLTVTGIIISFMLPAQLANLRGFVCKNKNALKGAGSMLCPTKYAAKS